MQVCQCSASISIFTSTLLQGIEQLENWENFSNYLHQTTFSSAKLEIVKKIHVYNIATHENILRVLILINFSFHIQRPICFVLRSKAERKLHLIFLSTLCEHLWLLNESINTFVSSKNRKFMPNVIKIRVYETKNYRTPISKFANHPNFNKQVFNWKPAKNNLSSLYVGTFHFYTNN